MGKGLKKRALTHHLRLSTGERDYTRQLLCYQKEEQKSLTLLSILLLSNDAKAKPERSTISRVGGGGHLGEPVKTPNTATTAFTAMAVI
jgi:hypothetical protein